MKLLMPIAALPWLLFPLFYWRGKDKNRSSMHPEMATNSSFFEWFNNHTAIDVVSNVLVCCDLVMLMRMVCKFQHSH